MRALPVRLRRFATAAVMVLALLVVPAWGQEEEPKEFREPGITYKTTEKAYIQWLAGALIVLACLFIAVKNPHRTHLD